MFFQKFTLNQVKIFSQTFAQAWSAVLQLASIPIYFLLLGIESYGLLGIFAAVESLIILIDMTISSSLSREIARKLISSSRALVKNLIITIGKYYFLIIFFSFFIFFSIVFFLLFGSLSKNTEINYIIYLSILVSLIIFIRLSISFLRSILIGDQKQITLSIISSIFITLRIVGSFILIHYVSNNIIIFLIWHCAIFVLEFLSLIILINLIFNKRKKQASSDSHVMREILSFAPNMFFIALSSLLITQSDRVLISLYYDLQVLGEYNYFKNFVLGMFVLSGGMFAYLYPTLSSLFLTKNWKKIRSNCKIISSVICWLVFPTGILLIFTANNFFDFFISQQVNFVFKKEILIVLILGTILNLLWMVPYAVQLASGLTFIPLIINLIFAPITIAFTWLGFEHLGTLSAPIIYLIYNICMLIFGCLLIDKHIPQINFVNLFFVSIYKPTLFGLSFFFLYFYKIVHLHLVYQFTIIITSIIIVLLISFKELRMLKN
jgi:O-antigen/teichoic acid export membrane protein